MKGERKHANTPSNGPLHTLRLFGKSCLVDHGMKNCHIEIFLGELFRHYTVTLSLLAGRCLHLPMKRLLLPALPAQKKLQLRRTLNDLTHSQPRKPVGRVFLCSVIRTSLSALAPIVDFCSFRKIRHRPSSSFRSISCRVLHSKWALLLRVFHDPWR